MHVLEQVFPTANVKITIFEICNFCNFFVHHSASFYFCPKCPKNEVLRFFEKSYAHKLFKLDFVFRAFTDESMFLFVY
jgi:hypothetical protein